MSTRSKRREAKRVEIRAQFARKVEEIVRQRERLRRPAKVSAFEYLEKVEGNPISRPDGTTRHIVRLKTVPGEPLERGFVVPFSRVGPVRHLSFGDQLDHLQTEVVHFTWRAMGMRAGDTEIRWYVPEVMSHGLTADEAKVFSAARKACAMLKVARQAMDWVSPHPGYSFLKEALDSAFDAAEEFAGETDPVSTRKQREVADGSFP